MSGTFWANLVIRSSSLGSNERSCVFKCSRTDCIPRGEQLSYPSYQLAARSQYHTLSINIDTAVLIAVLKKLRYRLNKSRFVVVSM